ncbi:MAG TPA: type III-A CRISPR-associated protein Csm2 [Bacteroidales bacterium]|nr:type III-A CRISPR-associated protein Csm2 [Bacteroidales bacterium]
MATLTKEMLNELTDEDVKILKNFGKDLTESGTSVYVDKKGSRNEVFLKPMSTSQLRKFFGALKRIQADFERFKDEIPLLQPKLAYVAGKDKDKDKDKYKYKDKDKGTHDKVPKTKIWDFYNEISPLISEINGDEKKFKNFVSIVEAIIAYHKFFGGE